jgi:acylphosphatase
MKYIDGEIVSLGRELGRQGNMNVDNRTNRVRRHAILSRGMAANPRTARRWFIRGRVQGVGFRYFAQRAAVELGLTGYVRNLDDGGVEVFAAGPEEQISRFAALLRRGPRMAQVRTVEERTAEPGTYTSFEIEP